MQLVAFKREQEQHRLHIQRVRTQKSMIDSSTPESLGLKHLAVRPKKQQLIEDRRQKVAKENAKLMTGMTKIMNEKRSQPRYCIPLSLNEVERKREVDRVNFENNLMLDRLNRIAPTFSVTDLEDEFKKHLKAEANLRRRQMKPLALPKDMTMNRVKDGSSTFDASTYASQHENFGKSAGGSSILQDDEFSGGSPIKSMKEFRQHVIGTKKLGASAGMNTSSSSTAMSAAGTSASLGTAAGTGGGGQQGFRQQQRQQQQEEDVMLLQRRSMRDASAHRNEALFEVSHEP